MTQTEATAAGTLPARSGAFDVWPLGGISVLVWGVLWLLQSHQDLEPVKAQLDNLPFTASTLSLLVNYPHFMASYKIAYSRGPEFLRRYWVQLVLVPVLLVVLFVAAALLVDTPMGSARPFFHYPHVGELLLGVLVNLMFFTVGWHYTKQSFGCMMVYARYERYEFSPRQRLLVRYSLLAIWLLAFVQSNLYGTGNDFFGLTYQSLSLPRAALVLAILAYVGLNLATVFGVFFWNHQARGAWPSLNVVIPYVAMNVWWVPLIRQPILYLTLTPFFHSLQYLVFVRKIEGRVAESHTDRAAYLTKVTLGLVASGWLLFELVPGWLDHRYAGHFGGLGFFIIAANLFINIHHYFIDNAIWRLQDPVVRAALF